MATPTRHCRSSTLPCFLLLALLSLLPLLVAATDDTLQLEDELHVLGRTRPKITAMGLVYCDQCKHGLHDNQTVPLQDVEVRVKCRDLYGFVTFSAVGFTNAHGAFSIPMDDIPSIFGIASCTASLVRSLNEHCDIMSDVGGGHSGAPLLLKSKSLMQVVFTTAPFAFHPSSPPINLCHPPLHNAGNTYSPPSPPPPPKDITHGPYFYLSPPPPPPPPAPYWYRSPPPSPYYWYKSPPPPFIQAHFPPSFQAHSPPLLSPSHPPYFPFHHYRHHYSPPPPPPYYYASPPPSSTPIQSHPPPPPPYYYASPPPPPPIQSLPPPPYHYQTPLPLSPSPYYNVAPPYKPPPPSSHPFLGTPPPLSYKHKRMSHLYIPPPRLPHHDYGSPPYSSLHKTPPLSTPNAHPPPLENTPPKYMPPPPPPNY